MRRLFTFLIILTLSSCSLIPGAAAAQVMAQQYEIVIELDAGEDPRAFARFFVGQLAVPYDEQCFRIADADLSCRIHHVYEHAIVGFSVFLTEAEIAKAERLFGEGRYGVRNIELSTEVGLPLVAGSMGAVNGNGLAYTQIVPRGVERLGGGLVDAGNVTVAVLDTGGAVDHPDINWGEGYDCTGLPTDGERVPWYDDNGHGTHVAGTIAARDNGMGVVGVAPNARIVPVKVLSGYGSGSTAGVICGIDYAVEHRDEIDIVNMSLGGVGWETACGEDDPMHNAICVLTEEVIVVVAAGNGTADVATFSPANYPSAITVSAYTDYDGVPGGFGLMPALSCATMSVDDELATFSNYGPGVDATAPGVCVLSTLPPREVNGTLIPQYGYGSGTSMASPHGAGCFAVYLAQNPDQRHVTAETVLRWSTSRSPYIAGDHDDYSEPLLHCDGIPRWQGEG